MVKHFKYGHASTPKWQAAAQQCLAQLGDIEPTDNLGFLYATDLLASDMADILAFFKHHTKIPHWVGTVGIGICSTAQEYFDVPAIAVMVGAFPENAFQVFRALTNQNDLEEFNQDHHIWSSNQQAVFAIAHGDPRNDQITQLILQLSEGTGGGFLVGGLASSRGQYAHIADELIKDEEQGMSGVLFSNDVAVSTRLSQGCSAIGPRRQITSAEHNVVMKIDNRPALDVFNEDIGEVLAQDLNKVAGYIFVALPIPGSDTGDYMVRNLVGIDPENRMLAVGELVKPGMPIMFTRRDANSAHEDLVKMLHSIQHDLKQPPKGGVYYSCLGRGANLFGNESQELKTIQAELGDFPLVGFFANGEIYHQRLYGYTGVLTLFL